MLGVAFHWEAGTPRDNHDDCPAQVESIKAYHDSVGYAPGSAYNWLYCQHGGIYEGRGWGRLSAANGSTWSNLNFFAICFMSGPGYPFTDLAKVAARTLYDQQGGEPRPHSDFFATFCPGDEIREWLTQGLPYPLPPLPPSTPPIEEEDELQPYFTVDGLTNYFYHPAVGMVPLLDAQDYDGAQYNRGTFRRVTISQAEFDRMNSRV